MFNVELGIKKEAILRRVRAIYILDLETTIFPVQFPTYLNTLIDALSIVYFCFNLIRRTYLPLKICFSSVWQKYPTKYSNICLTT